MEQIDIDTPRHSLYGEFKKLYTLSFPLFEQRTEEQQFVALAHPAYRLEAFCCGGQLVGFIACWEFSAYRYVEHFAIHPHLRGQGFGHRVLTRFIEKSSKPVLLEIDPVTDPVSEARLRFYSRCGFVENDFVHTHPPYREGIQPHPLKVLSTRRPLSADEYQQFNDDLNKVVMNMDAVG